MHKISRIIKEVPRELMDIFGMAESVQDSSCIFQIFSTTNGKVRIEGTWLTPDESLKFKEFIKLNYDYKTDVLAHYVCKQCGAWHRDKNS